jgi:hypothetical protein
MCGKVAVPVAERVVKAPVFGATDPICPGLVKSPPPPSPAGGHVRQDFPKTAKEGENFGVTRLELDIVIPRPSGRVVGRQQIEMAFSLLGIIVAGDLFADHACRAVGIGERGLDRKEQRGPGEVVGRAVGLFHGHIETARVAARPCEVWLGGGAAHLWRSLHILDRLKSATQNPRNSVPKRRVVSRCGRSEMMTLPREVEAATKGRLMKSVAVWRLIR